MFHDRAQFGVEGGRGGSGAISFRREKFVPKGGPDGGDGGHGGSVILVADPDLRDLSAFRTSARIKAGRGNHGEGGLRRGADGADVEVRVPVGTQVMDASGELVADLAHPGARLVAAKGGRGGAGNRRFVSPTHQVPRIAEPGQAGESADIELHLKLLADAALLGFPNAGKSSLLRRISNAKPKVADYPFTTLAPVLGTVEAADGRQLVVADVPGLLEGASEGVGLGDEFLAHLERARLLVHVIDVHEGELEERFRTIDGELQAYGAGLADLPQIIVLNKIDLLATLPSLGLDDPRILAVVPLSTVTGAGVAELVRLLFAEVETVEAPPVSAGEALVDYLVYRPKPSRRRTFRILRNDEGAFVVAGPDLASTPREQVEEALRGAGVREGDVVTIGDETLEWTP
jgi:GTP-binding protein